MGDSIKSKIIVLHEDDNVGVAISPIQVRELLFVNNLTLSASANISFGHKIAIKPMAAGEVIIKYGVPIGAATKEISAGDHVHIHNMESLYMKQFTK